MKERPMKTVLNLAAMVGIALAVAACARTPGPVQMGGLIEADPTMEIMVEQAEQGDPVAQRRLAERYLRGVDEIEFENYEEAVYWYGEAANQGDTESRRMLGHLYRVGQGVERDLGESFYWYEQAAQSGDPEAQYWTGVALAEWGDAVTPDLVTAYSWLDLASQSDLDIADDAAEARNRIADELGAQDLTWARLMARDFEPTRT